MPNLRTPRKLEAFKEISKGSLAKVKAVTNKKIKMDSSPSQFAGVKSTAQAASEGRLKVAASSKYKPKLKAAIKKAKAKKGGYLNLGS